jgi:hypothetical protein
MAIILNDNIQSNVAKPVDNKYGIFSSGTFRSYTSVAEANSSINVSYRSVGQTVLINVGGVNHEYWYRAGVTDSDLVAKSSVVTVNTPLSLVGGTMSILAANGSQGGYLTATDWNTFNSKLSSIVVTGSVVGTGASGTPLQLQGDSTSPGNSRYYGTDGSGVKGYFTLPSDVISSVFGRTGTVTAQSGDYTFAQIGSKPTTLSGYGITDAQSLITAGTTSQYYRGDKTFVTLDKTAVGLANVQNVDQTNASNLSSGSIPTGRFGSTTVPIAAINATGTPSSSTLLRGDGTWATVTGITKDDFTLTTDGTRTTGAGVDLIYIRINPSSSLTTFKVGTTLGGNDIVPDQTIASGGWTTIDTNLFFSSSVTLYFGGITSSTDIGLVKV